MTETLVAIVAGLVAGVLSGLFGIGGALLTTPVVRLILERPEIVSVGTPLVVVVPTAIVAAALHLRRGSAELGPGMLVGVLGAPMAVGGAWLADRVGGSAVLLLTGAVLVYLGVRVTMPASRPKRRESKPPPGAAAHITLGVLAGFVSGFLGLGGGFILVPGFMFFLGYSPLRAVGTSLVAISVFSIPGALTHAVLGNVDLPLALWLTLGVLPGATLGARLAHKATDSTLRAGFALLLVSAGLVLGATEGMALVGG